MVFRLEMYLNSIMILLIRLICLMHSHVVPEFKFHYDSINSLDPDTVYIRNLKFKFHYDSINSKTIRL